MTVSVSSVRHCSLSLQESTDTVYYLCKAQRTQFTIFVKDQQSLFTIFVRNGRDLTISLRPFALPNRTERYSLHRENSRAKWILKVGERVWKTTGS